MNTLISVLYHVSLVIFLSGLPALVYIFLCLLGILRKSCTFLRLYWKPYLILIITSGAMLLSYPPKDKIKLGLDLQGGMHLVFQVITDDAVNIETDQEILRLENLFKKKNINYENISKGKLGEFIIGNINPDQEGKIKDLLDENFKEWNYSISRNTVHLSLKPNVIRYIRDQSVNQAVETIRNRVDEFGLAEVPIQRQGLGGERIIVELPGVPNPDRMMNLIKTTAILEWKLVTGGPAPTVEKLLEDYDGKVPEGMEVLRGDPRRTEGGYYLVSRVAPVTGKDLRNARPSVDDWNNPAVAFTLDSEGAKRFYKFTSENIGNPLAIILDGKIQSVANIKDRISDRGIIQGRFTSDQVEDLSLVLRAGALPASIKTLENRTIGPSLGADSIRKGLSSIIIALILIMVFMVFYYRLSGFNAILALILNIILLMGALSYFEATLTLPGIAGIILTIGMAVDANVLVFERIREELALGKSVMNAVATGFSRAFRTILDANVTTIIAAVFLFQFGTGPIKGFAITLIIGISASVFTAVFVSRTIFELILSRKKGRAEKMSI